MELLERLIVPLLTLLIIVAENIALPIHEYVDRLLKFFDKTRADTEKFRRETGPAIHAALYSLNRSRMRAWEAFELNLRLNALSDRVNPNIPIREITRSDDARARIRASGILKREACAVYVGCCIGAGSVVGAFVLVWGTWLLRSIWAGWSPMQFGAFSLNYWQSFLDDFWLTLLFVGAILGFVCVLFRRWSRYLEREVAPSQAYGGGQFPSVSGWRDPVAFGRRLMESHFESWSVAFKHVVFFLAVSCMLLIWHAFQTCETGDAAQSLQCLLCGASLGLGLLFLNPYWDRLRTRFTRLSEQLLCHAEENLSKTRFLGPALVVFVSLLWLNCKRMHLGVVLSCMCVVFLVRLSLTAWKFGMRGSVIRATISSLEETHRQFVQDFYRWVKTVLLGTLILVGALYCIWVFREKMAVTTLAPTVVLLTFLSAVYLQCWLFVEVQAARELRSQFNEQEMQKERYKLRERIRWLGW